MKYLWHGGREGSAGAERDLPDANSAGDDAGCSSVTRTAKGFHLSISKGFPNLKNARGCSKGHEASTHVSRRRSFLDGANTRHPPRVARNLWTLELRCYLPSPSHPPSIPGKVKNNGALKRKFWIRSRVPLKNAFLLTCVVQMSVKSYHHPLHSIPYSWATTLLCSKYFPPAIPFFMIIRFVSHKVYHLGLFEARLDPNAAVRMHRSRCIAFHSRGMLIESWLIGSMRRLSRRASWRSPMDRDITTNYRIKSAQPEPEKSFVRISDGNLIKKQTRCGVNVIYQIAPEEMLD